MNQERIDKIFEANDIHDEKLAKALSQILEEFSTDRTAIANIDKGLASLLNQRNRARGIRH